MEFQQNIQYSDATPALKSVRDAVEGEPAVKRQSTTYLKHPNPIDPNSDEQIARYRAYIDGAEWKAFPSDTLGSMVGLMTEGEVTIDLPPGIDYLEQNSDGDGMPLTGAIEVIYNEILQTKYYILLAEFKGLPSIGLDQISIADLKILNPRASIKHYTRESFIDWEFRRINGTLQLSMLLLTETSTKRDANFVSKTQMTTYLMLALDEDGNYFQQKYLHGDDGSANPDGDRHYPIVNGQKLKWIPVEIVVDEETPAGKIPKGMGYLYPICSNAYDQYRVSADFKEALRHMQPTTFTSGWRDDGIDVFEKLNGRKYIAFGAGVANNLPEGVTVDIKGLGIVAEPFERYFERKDREARALGAKINDGSIDVADTATKAGIDNANNTAIMKKISRNVEAALKRVVSYCAMYQGLWSADDVEDNLDKITIDIPRDFGDNTLSAQEVAEIRANVQASLISKKEGLRQLVAGGWTVEDADTILDEIEDQGPELTDLPLLPGQEPPLVPGNPVPDLPNVTQPSTLVSD